MSSTGPKQAIYENLAEVAQALGHPHRLELLEHLAQGVRTVEELSARAHLTFANTSRHLQILRRARLVDTERIFARNSIPGDDLFYEHVHLNFAGNDLLARTLAPELAALLPGLAPASPPDEQTVAHDLAYTGCDDSRARTEISAMMRRPPFAKHAAEVPPPRRDVMDEAKTRYLEILQHEPDVVMAQASVG